MMFEIICEVPAKDTQLFTLLAALQRGEQLTMAKALNAYGIGALSQRVGDLKKLGWPVRSELTKVPSGKRVSVYWMDNAAAELTVRVGAAEPVALDASHAGGEQALAGRSAAPNSSPPAAAP